MSDARVLPGVGIDSGGVHRPRSLRCGRGRRATESAP